MHACEKRPPGPVPEPSLGRGASRPGVDAMATVTALLDGLGLGKMRGAFLGDELPHIGELDWKALEATLSESGAKKKDVKRIKSAIDDHYQRLATRPHTKQTCRVPMKEAEESSAEDDTPRCPPSVKRTEDLLAEGLERCLSRKRPSQLSRKTPQRGVVRSNGRPRQPKKTGSTTRPVNRIDIQRQEARRKAESEAVQRFQQKLCDHYQRYKRKYTLEHEKWSRNSHASFPSSFRTIVHIVLMGRRQPGAVVAIPTIHDWERIFQFIDRADWNDNVIMAWAGSKYKTLLWEASSEFREGLTRLYSEPASRQPDNAPAHSPLEMGFSDPTCPSWRSFCGRNFPGEEPEEVWSRLSCTTCPGPASRTSSPAMATPPLLATSSSISRAWKKPGY